MANERIAVVGLGYVGLPLAVELAGAGLDVVGFDIDQRRIEELRAGHDRTREVEGGRLQASGLRVTHAEDDLADRTAFVVTVPTPVDESKSPDLGIVLSACETIGRQLRRGDVVVFESTVYPGVTEDLCGPRLAEVSGLTCGKDFFLGYSPERINPGDQVHTLAKVVKVVSGQDEETLDRVAAIYEPVVEAGLHRASSIKVAEAAKVIENTQRDLNIALMNELALIFDRLGLRTDDVLAAAGTKWNFLPFKPGLVGGHCIGVDPYYLTQKAQAVGYHPEVILAGRRVNDGMGRFVAQKVVKTLLSRGKKGALRVGVLGLTFKEDVPDLRNSQVPLIIEELRSFGIEPLLHDPLADPAEARHEYGLELATDLAGFTDLDAVVLAVPHKAYLDDTDRILGHLVADGVLFDVKAAVGDRGLGDRYWSL